VGHLVAGRGCHQLCCRPTSVICLVSSMFYHTFITLSLYHAAGWLDSHEEDLSHYSAELLTQTERFEALRSKLYSRASDAGLAYLYDGVQVNTTQFSVSPSSTALVASYHVVSLSEAMLEYVAHSRGIGALDPANVSDAMPSVSYVLAATLRGSSIHNALNESSLQWLDVSLESRATVTTTLLGIYVSLAALLLLVAVAVLLPVLVWVDSAKDQSLRALASLPTTVIAKLRQQATRNMKHLAHEDEDEETDSQASDSDDSMEAAEEKEPKLLEESSADDGSMADVDWSTFFSRTPGAKPTSKRSKRSGASASGTDEESSSTPSRASSKKRAIRRSTTRNLGDAVKYRKSCWSLAVLILKFCSPLLLVFIFVTIIYFESVRTLEQTLAAGSVAFASSQRAVLSMDVMSWLRKSLRTTGDPAAIAPIVEHTTRALDDLEYFHRLLQFGTVAAAPQTAVAALAGAGTSDLLTSLVNEQVRQLMSTDMCAALWTFDSAAFPVPIINATTVPIASALGAQVEYGTSVDDCRARMSGVMSRSGYHGALLEYLDLSRRVRDLRAAAVIDASGAGYVPTVSHNGTAISVPTSLFEMFHLHVVSE